MFCWSVLILQEHRSVPHSGHICGQGCIEKHLLKQPVSSFQVTNAIRKKKKKRQEPMQLDINGIKGISRMKLK